MNDLTKMSAQEVFDAVVKHMLEQNCQSIREGYDNEGEFGVWDDEPVCGYHGVNGMKSAAGIFISDSDYHPDMEGYGWYDLPKHFPVIPTDHMDMICELEDIHNEVHPDYWEEYLQEYADEHNLTFNK